MKISKIKTNDITGKYNFIPLEFMDDALSNWANVIFSVMANGPEDKVWSCERLHEEHGDLLGSLDFIRKIVRHMCDEGWVSFFSDYVNRTSTTETVHLFIENFLPEKWKESREGRQSREGIFCLFRTEDLVREEPENPGTGVDIDRTNEIDLMKPMGKINQDDLGVETRTEFPMSDLQIAEFDDQSISIMEEAQVLADAEAQGIACGALKEASCEMHQRVKDSNPGGNEETAQAAAKEELNKVYWRVFFHSFPEIMNRLIEVKDGIIRWR